MNKDTWTKIFDDDVTRKIVEDINLITKLCDQQAFGMPRDSATQQIKERLVVVRSKLDEFEKLLP